VKVGAKKQKEKSQTVVMGCRTQVIDIRVVQLICRISLPREFWRLKIACNCLSQLKN